MTDMPAFPKVGQDYPTARPPEMRIRDFNEIYLPFDPANAVTQSSRCSQCGIPFCQIHCPLSNNIPDWLKLAAEGRLEEAYAISSATNSFPEVCGRICPQDKLCEGNCVIERGFGAVTIGAVEKYITETAFEQGWVKPIKVASESGYSVGIIGAGPGGLAAADYLRRLGHEVHVYDRYDRVGGLMIYGIPNFKLEKHVVARRHQLLADSGVIFHLNCEIGRDITLAQLRERHDSVLIATGVYRARDIALPDCQLSHIIPALPYLTAGNRKGLGEKAPGFDSGEFNAAGKRVVVIGGGDTAMDCVRTAVRQGATSVTCLYRRDRANMPGSAREVKNAEEEGVQFRWLSAPIAFAGNDAGALAAIQVQPMRLTIQESTGRQAAEPIEDERFTLEADLAIMALGFEPEELPSMFKAPDLLTTSSGTLAINPVNYETSLNGVFAAGDIVRGASLVVWAIKDGRDAAASMHRHMMQKTARRVA